MKQKDMVVIGLSVFLSAVVGFIITSQFLVPAKNTKQRAPVVAPITAQFDLPDGAIFNEEAINPTKLIEIAPNDNNQPFANQQQ